jgi:hypothetical protein
MLVNIFTLKVPPTFKTSFMVTMKAPQSFKTGFTVIVKASQSFKTGFTDTMKALQRFKTSFTTIESTFCMILRGSLMRQQLLSSLDGGLRERQLCENGGF